MTTSDPHRLLFPDTPGMTLRLHFLHEVSLAHLHCQCVQRWDEESLRRALLALCDHPSHPSGMHPVVIVTP